MFQQVDKRRGKVSYLRKFYRHRSRSVSDRSVVQLFRVKLKMANTLSVMANVLRNAVSKQRIRYKEKGFNLDLAYICDNIIAMGYPADMLEGLYRNRIEDVYKFLEENHHDHYKIYNLCLERSYDISKFHGRVALYPFEDHNPPTMELIQKFCCDVDSWLKLDPLNVAAIHCKAGKGRTGTMICCYLLYSGIQPTAADALACYDEKRTKDKKGVTIPSQRRYVQYFSNLIQSGLQYEKRTLQFCEIRFSDAQLLHSQGAINCSISVLNEASTAKVQTLQTHTIDFRKGLTLEMNNPALYVTGDIKVELTHKTSRKKLFHFWFNTYFVCDIADIEEEGHFRKLVYTLYKCEIDDAHKDKEHKVFSEDFKIQAVFLDLNSTQANNSGVKVAQQTDQNMHHHHRSNKQSNNFSENHVLPRNSNSSGSDMNYMRDQKSSSSASTNSLTTYRCGRYIENNCTPSSPHKHVVDIKGTICNHEPSDNLVIEDAHALPSSVLDAPELCAQVQKKKYPSTKQTAEHKFNMLESNALKDALKYSNNHVYEHYPSAHTSNSLTCQNYAEPLQHNGDYAHVKCSQRFANNNNPNSNVSDDSSRSIRSRSSSSGAGDNQEDWESGESTYL